MGPKNARIMNHFHWTSEASQLAHRFFKYQKSSIPLQPSPYIGRESKTQRVCRMPRERDLKGVRVAVCKRHCECYQDNKSSVRDAVRTRC